MEESIDLKYCKDSKAFIEYSIDIDIFKNIEEHNPGKKHKKLFCLMIYLLICLAIKNLIQLTELYIRSRKLILFCCTKKY